MPYSYSHSYSYICITMYDIPNEFLCMYMYSTCTWLHEQANIPVRNLIGGNNKQQQQQQQE